MKFYSILLVILVVKITDFKISAQDSGDYLVSNEANLSLKNTVSKPVYEYKVYYYKNQLDKISDEEAGEHFLGEMIAKKFYLFEKKYL